MTQEITIRQWSADDWQAFRDIRLEALSKSSDVFSASFADESGKDEVFWRGRIGANDQCALFGLYDQDTVIGMTAIYRDWNRPADAAVLCMSYIRKEYRGRGLADLLYKLRIDWAKAQNGMVLLSLHCREGNEASFKAGQRWGFSLSRIDENHQYGNGEIGRDYIYELKI